MSRLARSEWLLALGCGGWVAAFDARHGWAFVLLGALTVPILLLVRRRPVVAAIGVLVIFSLHWALGGATESPGVLAPALACAFALGRYAAIWTAVAWIGANAVLLLARDDPASSMFAVFLLGAPALFGVLVRRRSASARTAEQLLADAAARDPAAVAAEVVAAERTRLARDTVALVREAVASMQAAAIEARDGLVRGKLAEIQTLGRSAVTDLRRLLGLLRDEGQHEPPTPTATRPPWHADVATAFGLCLLAGIEMATLDPPSGPAGAVLAILMAAPIALRRSDPMLACLAVAAVTATSIGLQAPTVGGFWSAIVALLLAWTVGTTASRRAWAALALLVVVRVVAIRLHAPGNEAMEIAFFVVGSAAGYLWAERERVERSALVEVAKLSADTSFIVDAAVRDERLRVARELHDVTSHAVGVMVVQAGAALALAESDPRSAENAVIEIERAGTQALAELDVLARILAQGRPEHADDAAVSGDVSGELLALVRRMTAGGLRITHNLVDLRAEDPELRRTAYRIVQEALTNVLRHAPDSDVTITTVNGDDAIELRITNRAQPAPAKPAAPESGFGLVGLAERVRSLGGTLSAGPSDAGGFTVLARLPVARTDHLKAVP